MQKHIRLLLLLLLFGLLTIASCGGDPYNEEKSLPTATVTAMPDPTITATATATDIPTRPVPTATLFDEAVAATVEAILAQQPMETYTTTIRSSLIQATVPDQEVYPDAYILIDFDLSIKEGEEILFEIFPWESASMTPIAFGVIGGPFERKVTIGMPSRGDISSGRYVLYGHQARVKPNGEVIKYSLVFTSEQFSLTVIDRSCRIPIADFEFKSQPLECKEFLRQQKINAAYNNIEVEGSWIYQGNELYTGPFTLTNITSGETREFPEGSLVSFTTFEIWDSGILPVGNSPQNGDTYLIETIDRGNIWLLPLEQ